MREPGYEAKMLIEALREEADSIGRGGPAQWVVGEALENVARRFTKKVYVRDQDA